MPRLPRALTLLALAFTIAGTAACGKGKPGELPPGDTLLKESAAAMREVQTVRFAIESDGTIAGLALRRAGGQLTRDGEAKGTALVQQFGVNVEVEFVVVGDSIHIKGPTGGWQTMPLALASTVYDPSAILDPERGIAKVLDSARDGRTETREKLDGVDTYRVKATLDAGDLAAIVPGATGDVAATVWLAVDTKRLVRATFTMPGTDDAPGANVTVSFSEFDAPVSISAP